MLALLVLCLLALAPGAASAQPVLPSTPLASPTTAGEPYSHTFTASGGTAPYSYSLVTGSLPVGMSMSSAGLFSGTPTIPGPYNFTVRVTDDDGLTDDQAYSLTVVIPVITINPPDLADGVVGTPFSQTITASGSPGPYSFSLLSGTLPIGTSLSSAGVFSGTPTADGAFSMTIGATDLFLGLIVAKIYNFNIAPPTIVMSPAGLPSTTVGTAYSQSLSTTGGIAPYTYSLSAGALPPGVAMSSAGVFSGTPVLAGAYAFTVRVTDDVGYTTTKSYTIAVSNPGLTLTPPPGSLPPVTAGTSFSQTFSIAGGSAPYSFSLAAGALPPGVSLSSAGVMSGTPTTAGAFSLTLRGEEAGGAEVFGAYILDVAPPTITISPPAGVIATVEAYTSFSRTFTAAGGTSPYSYSLISGALPVGVSLSSAGHLSGTPSTPGSYTFNLRATDDLGFSATQAYTVVVTAPAIALSPAAGALPPAVAHTPFSQTFIASGGTAPYSYSLPAGALPPGVSLSSGGVLSGAPTTLGTYNFSVAATDANGFSVTQAYSVMVTAPTIGLTPPAGALPAGTIGAPYSLAFTASGGSAPYSFSLPAGALPPGTSLSATGQLTGTPTTLGSYNFTVEAEDAHGFAATAIYTLTISDAAPVAVADAVTTLGGQATTILVTANDTGGPATSIIVASGPSNGTATASGLQVTYTSAPTFSGTDSFTYLATGPGGSSAPATVTVTVNPAPIVAAPISIEILQGQTATADLTAGASGGPFIAAALASLTPAGSGTATISSPSSGQYRLTFTPADAFAGAVTATYTLTNAYATSAPGTVTITVIARPDPSKDPEVTGLISAQNDAARRFAGAQIGNINSRLEQLRAGVGVGDSLRLGFSGGSREPDEMLDPGLRSRLSELGLLRAEPGRANGFDQGGGEAGNTTASDGRLGLWAGGIVDFGRRDATTAQKGVKFTTDGLTAGLDYRFSDRLVLGGAVGWGQDRSKVGSNGTRSEADGYSLALYGGLKPRDGLFVDGVVGWGNLDFESRRYITASGDIALGKRDGEQWFAAVTGGWDLDRGGWTLSPYGRLALTRSTLEAFAETTGGPFALAYDEQTLETTTGTIGLRAARTLKQPYGFVTPRGRLEYSHDFQGSERAGLSYVDWAGGPTYGAYIAPLAQDRFSIGLGLELITNRGLRLGLDYDAVLGDDLTQQQIRLQVQGSF